MGTCQAGLAGHMSKYSSRRRDILRFLSKETCLCHRVSSINATRISQQAQDISHSTPQSFQHCPPRPNPVIIATGSFIGNSAPAAGGHNPQTNSPVHYIPIRFFLSSVNNVSLASSGAKCENIRSESFQTMKAGPCGRRKGSIKYVCSAIRYVHRSSL